MAQTCSKSIRRARSADQLAITNVAQTGGVSSACPDSRSMAITIVTQTVSSLFSAPTVSDRLTIVSAAQTISRLFGVYSIRSFGDHLYDPDSQPSLRCAHPAIYGTSISAQTVSRLFGTPNQPADHPHCGPNSQPYFWRAHPADRSGRRVSRSMHAHMCGSESQPVRSRSPLWLKHTNVMHRVTCSVP